MSELQNNNVGMNEFSEVVEMSKLRVHELNEIDKIYMYMYMYR
jgi:hypothetical protein